MERIYRRKAIQSTQFGVQNDKIAFVRFCFNEIAFVRFCFNITDALIIPLIFIFISHREKANEIKEFHHENSKPPRKT